METPESCSSLAGSSNKRRSDREDSSNYPQSPGIDKTDLEEFILAHSVTFAKQMMDVFRHDAGTYTCLATNTIGESMGKDVDIDVQCE